MSEREDLLKRGWAVRWVWRRKYDKRGVAARLRYLLTYDTCGIVHSCWAWRWHRFGPLFIDVLASRRELAAKAIEVHQALIYFRDNCEEWRAKAFAAQAELFELKRANPMMRAESVRGGN